MNLGGKPLMWPALAWSFRIHSLSCLVWTFILEKTGVLVVPHLQCPGQVLPISICQWGSIINPGGCKPRDGFLYKRMNLDSCFQRGETQCPARQVYWYKTWWHHSIPAQWLSDLSTLDNQLEGWWKCLLMGPHSVDGGEVWGAEFEFLPRCCCCCCCCWSGETMLWKSLPWQNHRPGEHRSRKVPVTLGPMCGF